MELFRAYVRRKSGAVKAMGKVVVQSSLRMVLSPYYEDMCGTVSIPGSIVEKRRMLECYQGAYRKSFIPSDIIVCLGTIEIAGIPQDT